MKTQTKKWAVIYLWEGARHRHLEDFTSFPAASIVAQKFIADGWKAWIEEVGS